MAAVLPHSSLASTAVTHDLDTTSHFMSTSSLQTNETMVGANEKSSASPPKDVEQASADVSSAEQHMKSETVASTKDPYEVQLDPHEDPKNFPAARKWLILFVICTGTLCATCASSMVSASVVVVQVGKANRSTQAALAERGISRDLHVSSEVTILGVSLFVLGLGESDVTHCVS